MSSQTNDKDSGPLADAGGAKNSPTEGATSHDRPNGADNTTKTRAPQALDRWFDDQLNRLFNDVSSEPLPPDLAKLIGQLKSQSQK